MCRRRLELVWESEQVGIPRHLEVRIAMQVDGAPLPRALAAQKLQAVMRQRLSDWRRGKGSLTRAACPT
eukprot:386362-Rhodomonas_salina.2